MGKLWSRSALLISTPLALFRKGRAKGGTGCGVDKQPCEKRLQAKRTTTSPGKQIFNNVLKKVKDEENGENLKNIQHFSLNNADRNSIEMRREVNREYAETIIKSIGIYRSGRWTLKVLLKCTEKFIMFNEPPYTERYVRWCEGNGE